MIGLILEIELRFQISWRSGALFLRFIGLAFTLIRHENRPAFRGSPGWRLSIGLTPSSLSREKLNVTDTYCLMTPDGERRIE